MKAVTDPALLALLNETAPKPEPEPEVEIDFDLINQKISEHQEGLKEKLKQIIQQSKSEVFLPECPVASKDWVNIITVHPPDRLHEVELQPVFPAHVLIGELQKIDLMLSGEWALSLPYFLPLAKRKGIFLKSTEFLLENIALRIACSLPPGVLQIHLIDLQSKGRAFQILGGLDSKVAPPAPADAEQFTALLKNLETRVSEITRRCLTRHKWLCDYNKANPDEPETYHLVCISAFPLGLEKQNLEAISRMLQHECAARAGVYFLFGSEENKPKPVEFEDIPLVYQENADVYNIIDSEIDTSPSGEFKDLILFPDSIPPDASSYVDALNVVSKAKPKAKKVTVEVEESQIWNTSAASGVSIPIGKAGREELHFRLGNDSVVHHALVGGATGMGKTILLHNIILNAAELYSPEDLQMILMDFKEGTEFACYEGLPHMRVLSIASELHFGHSVFEWLVAERMRRATLFKKAGVADLAYYSKKTGQKLPRLLVIMDEFQRLLADPQIGSQVSMLLDDIVRTGRSFGINLILSTQSLANVQMESSTLTSLGLRVCLRLSESETNKFLNHDNTVPTGFNRPGQALYNETEGCKEGNTEFQVAFVDVSEIPTRCDALRQREQERFSRQVVEEARVFHGEMPVNPEGRIPKSAPEKLQVFIGEPLKIQSEPVAINFEAQDGANLIAIGQGMEILNTLSNNLAIQMLQSALGPEIFVADSLPLAKERWAELVGKGIQFLTNPVQVNAALDNLTIELENRKMDEHAESFPPKVLFFIEPQLNKAFPPGNGMDSSPASLKVNTLLEQGPRLGLHIILITSRLARTDKVLGQYGSPLSLQHFATKVVFRTDEAEKLLGYDAPSKNIGEYSGVLSDESTGEMTPFQTYDSITT